MIVTFFRSSSFNAWSFCGMQYYLSYTLGLKPNAENGWKIPKPQFKADKGNLVHKALELLARQKFAIQNGEAEFAEDEIGKKWSTTTFTPDQAFEEAWEFYSKIRTPHWPWDAKEYRLCRKWTFDAITMQNGMWNPMNRHVVMPEQYFDIVIEEPWAKYTYKLPNGEKLDGYLGLKGTVDLITELDADTLEYLDWKTGMRKDWVSGKQKDWKKLRDDPQLRLYHYALTRLYPNRKHIIMTIVFIQDGGPFSLDFGPADIPKTEQMIRERFETIRNCERPPRIIGNGADKWKCERLCAFYQNEWKDTGKTVCNHIHQELLSIGMEKVGAKYSVGNATAYGSGGGVENRDSK